MQICPSCGEENPPRFRLCGFCGTPLEAALPALEVRKTVSIVFSDLAGSTSLGERLDPEALREVLTRYFDAMRSELERHGGRVEKYIGDAIMAVFGLVAVQEDDALRAVRAAHGMQQKLAELNDDLERRYGVRLTNRTGVNTGEVIAGDPTSGQRLVTGDAVNTAARLEQAAPPDQILVGPLTYQLVRHAAVVEAVEPLELKGKAERVPAYRLVDVDRFVGASRIGEAPLVGRENEMYLLQVAFDDARLVERPRMMTVVGDAGVGKSRLVHEFLGSVDGHAATLRGRCLSYGHGITFWPIIEVARAAAGIAEGDTTDEARTKLLALCGDLEVVARIGSIMGFDPTPFPISELYWGVRRLLERIAERGPIVVVVDDIHWAEPTFLELLDHLVRTAEGPLVILATSRRELLEQRPDWGGGDRSQRLVLEPLGAAEAEAMLEAQLGRAGLPSDLRDRILTAAEGNPLFIEQLLAMLLESGQLRYDDGVWVRADESGELAVPPTIQALLAARLDRLSREERLAIEPASVIGLMFPEAAIEELVSSQIRPDLAKHLLRLTDRGLIRPMVDDAVMDADYRFGHILIRDATYTSILKRARSELHERFVAWVDGVYAANDRAVEVEEICGYHLEQAYRYRLELGPLDDDGRRVGRDAAARLASAGRRAFTRGDMPAAADLLGRSGRLVDPSDQARLDTLVLLAEALSQLGQLDEADRVVDEALDLAARQGDAVIAAKGRIQRLFIANMRGTERWGSQVLAEADVAIPVFESAADHEALARTFHLLTWLHGARGDFGAAARTAESTHLHAHLGNDFRGQVSSALMYAQVAYYGPTTVAEAIARCETILADVRSDRGTEAIVRAKLAELLAMADETARAKELIESARVALLDLGWSVEAAALSTESWRIDMAADDPQAAERGLRRDIAILEAFGERYYLSTLLGGLTHVLLAQQRLADAQEACLAARAATTEDDVESDVLWRSGMALIEAARGESAAAIASATAAVARARSTDSPIWLADAIAVEARVHAATGDVAAAATRLDEAVALYRAKGDVVSARRVSLMLLEPV